MLVSWHYFSQLVVAKAGSFCRLAWTYRVICSGRLISKTASELRTFMIEIHDTNTCFPNVVSVSIAKKLTLEIPEDCTVHTCRYDKEVTINHLNRAC